MLVLQRKKNERVIITLPDGSNGEVVVVRFPHDGSVRLGFEFPNGVTIHRQEVQEAIDREQAT